MENIDIKNSKVSLLGKSLYGYILGIVGCVLSFIVCFMTFVIVVLYGKVKIAFVNNFGIENKKNFLYEGYIWLERILENILNAGITFLFIMIVGFILGLIGTIVSWHKASFLSSSIMIIGGVLSIISLIFPGVFLIIGGVLNIKCVFNNLNRNKYRKKLK